jgi:flagella basal body P-ring formation protein FlgA
MTLARVFSAVIAVALAMALPTQAQTQTQTRIACASGTAASACLQHWLASTQGVAPEQVTVQPLAGDVADAVALHLTHTTLSPRMQARVLQHDGQQSLHWFSVRVQREIPVWTRTADAGAAAVAGAPQWQVQDVAGLAAFETAMPELAGTTLRRRVRGGEPLRQQDLKTAADISAGDTVVFAVQENRIAITGLGRALEDGRVGAPLRVLPTHAATPITALAQEKR